MLSRLDIGADSFLRHLVIQDNLAGIAIQRHALPNTVFDGDDNLSATGETDRTLGCTTVRVELAYGMLYFASHLHELDLLVALSQIPIPSSWCIQITEVPIRMFRMFPFSWSNETSPTFDWDTECYSTNLHT